MSDSHRFTDVGNTVQSASSSKISFGTDLKNLSKKYNERTVVIKKKTGIGRVKKIGRYPWLMDNDCLREISSIGPRINPRIIGARGQFIFLIKYPTMPNTIATHTSKRVLRGE